MELQWLRDLVAALRKRAEDAAEQFGETYMTEGNPRAREPQSPPGNSEAARINLAQRLAGNRQMFNDAASLPN